MEIVGGRGSWLRAAAGSREVGEEEVDEERSVAVPEKGIELGWDAEEPDDEARKRSGHIGTDEFGCTHGGITLFCLPFWVCYCCRGG